MGKCDICCCRDRKVPESGIEKCRCIGFLLPVLQRDLYLCLRRSVIRPVNGSCSTIFAALCISCFVTHFPKSKRKLTFCIAAESNRRTARQILSQIYNKCLTAFQEYAVFRFLSPFLYALCFSISCSVVFYRFIDPAPLHGLR